MASSDSSNSSDEDWNIRITSANTKFALALYKQQAGVQAGDGNIFLSPISISMALAMTYLGARGKTMSEMKKAMFLNDVSEADLHETFRAMRESLASNDQSCQLHLANSLFGQQSYKFLDDYLQSTAKFYGSRLTTVDFINDRKGAVDQINRWASDNTNKKIENAVSDDALDSATRLVLVNAIYFKGDWNAKFDIKYTTEADFHVSPTEKIKVQMMLMRSARARYGENRELQCKAIQLWYKGKSLSMIVVLPKHKKDSLEDLESKLTADHLLDIDTKFTMCGNRDLTIWMPRFKLEESVQLNDILKKIGINNLFTEGIADLSGIDGSKELFVSQAMHKAVVEVNEEGTEAAAVTRNYVCCGYTEKAEFCADHPFLFFIRDEKTKVILFMGRVVRP